MHAAKRYSDIEPALISVEIKLWSIFLRPKFRIENGGPNTLLWGAVSRPVFDTHHSTHCSPNYCTTAYVNKYCGFLFFLRLLRFCRCIREISPTVLQKESIHINQREKETVYAIIKHVLRKDENLYLWLGLRPKKSFFPKGPSSKNRGRPRYNTTTNYTIATFHWKFRTARRHCIHKH